MFIAIEEDIEILNKFSKAIIIDDEIIEIA
jgi:hypothetical protein